MSPDQQDHERDEHADGPAEDDPRMREQGKMPVETIDSVHNMPGQQDHPPPASAVSSEGD